MAPNMRSLGFFLLRPNLPPHVVRFIEMRIKTISEDLFEFVRYMQKKESRGEVIFHFYIFLGLESRNHCIL